MKDRILIMCAVVILLTAMPAAAQVDPRTIPIWVGGNIDVHNNTGQVAHDFHLEGYVKHNPVGPGSPSEPSGPIQIGYINRAGARLPFPIATNTKTHMGGDLWKVTADWSSLDVNPSEVGHFGLFYDVCCRNVWLKFDAWWTDSAGNRITPPSTVGWPVLGFEVPSQFSEPLDPPPTRPDQAVFRLHSDSGEELIDTEIIAMDLMSMTTAEAVRLGGMEDVFSMLNVEDMDALNRWAPVPGIGPDNPMDFPADSFFDVFFELDVAGVPALGDGDLLLARTLATWPDEPAGRWFFHAHQNHVPEPATLGLFAAGALLVLRRRRRA